MQPVLDPATLTRKASTTFYLASLFFAPSVRADVLLLYSYLRLIDDAVDASPPDTETFQSLVAQTHAAYAGGAVAHPIVNAFIKRVREIPIDFAYIQANIDAQAADMRTTRYATYASLDSFIYGVAEIVGLCIAAILRLPTESHESARALGRAMQLINIVRDIHQDYLLGKVYLPQDALQQAGLSGVPLTYNALLQHKEAIERVIQDMLRKALSHMSQAEDGFSYLPFRAQIAVRIAAYAYRFLATYISSHPYAVFERRVKVPYRRLGWGVCRAIVDTLHNRLLLPSVKV